MESDDLGFSYTENKDLSVVINHHGRFATKFTKSRASKVMNQLCTLDFNGQQQLMARLTGYYKHGNERVAKDHLRNIGG